MIGIYKITSPDKKVYIGQSIHIEKRIKLYKRGHNCVDQPGLRTSFEKHGADNHKFEILCECDLIDLNYKERYYQELFESIGKNGLNKVLAPNKDKVKQISWWVRNNIEKPKTQW